MEQKRIFGERWLCAGRAEQIEKPGKYFLFNTGSESLILLRDHKGEPHAFYNVCRHRGTRLCSELEGSLRSSIQCPYHAWTYALDGSLIGAPSMDDVPDFSKVDYPLNEAALVEWEGFLYVNVSDKPISLEEHFAALIGKFSQWRLSELRVARKSQYEVKANWKLIVQNYSECYHCELVHPELSRLSITKSGYNDLHEGSFLGGYMEIDPQYESMTASGRFCAAPIGNGGSETAGRVYYYSLFPNHLLSLHPDYVMTHRLIPQAPDSTLVICEWLFDALEMAGADFNPDDAVRFWDTTNREDWEVCELSQLGVASKAYSPTPYSPRESLLAAFDREYLSALGEID
jgi:Rieske 2Fe-2S family protein